LDGCLGVEPKVANYVSGHFGEAAMAGGGGLKMRAEAHLFNHTLAFTLQLRKIMVKPQGGRSSEHVSMSAILHAASTGRLIP
jgi:hypothetical protein